MVTTLFNLKFKIIFMEVFKMEWMDCEQFSEKTEGDIYDEDLLMRFLDEGIINDAEAGFMLGYLGEI